MIYLFVLFFVLSIIYTSECFPRQCLPRILGENAPAPNADVPSSLDPEERATSAHSGGLANFRSDGDKSRHPCKESPEDSQAVFASGYTRYSRWQSPQKSIICNLLYLERQDMLSRLPIYHLHVTHNHISRNYTSCENSAMPHYRHWPNLQNLRT